MAGRAEFNLLQVCSLVIWLRCMSAAPLALPEDTTPKLITLCFLLIFLHSLHIYKSSAAASLQADLACTVDCTS